MRIGDVMLVWGSLDLLRPLSSHGKPNEESVDNHLTLRKVELRESTCVKTDRINVHPVEVAVSQQHETDFFAP